MKKKLSVEYKLLVSNMNNVAGGIKGILIRQTQTGLPKFSAWWESDTIAMMPISTLIVSGKGMFLHSF